MGYGRFNTNDYASYSSTVKHLTRDELYSRTSYNSTTKSGQEVNADKIAFRESRDSEANPCSTPILVGLDVTGSMGFIPEYLTKEGLGKFVGQILQRKPIPDPHILFIGIGDAHYDRAPLQATQFESDNRICDQLTDIWLEGGGGGNDFESYDLAWAFAAYRTKTDAWDKRQSKGYLFTIGDEMFPKQTNLSYMKKVFLGDCPQSPSPDNLLEDAKVRYSVFHIIVTEGSFARGHLQKVQSSWSKLGRRAITITNHQHIPELMVSAIALDTGEKLENVLGWWDQSVARSIQESLS